MEDVKKCIMEAVNRERLIQLCLDLTNISTPTGGEQPAAEYMFKVFSEMGLKAFLQEVSTDRCNAIGILKGSDGKKRLMFNGHMDTSYTGEEQELGEAYKANASLKGDWIFGMGVYNMKSALAAYVGAVEALQKAGVSLKGDVLIAAVVGEIEKAAVDRYQGPEYAGYGSGARHLITHGVTADMCILGEPTGLDIHPGGMGTTWARITTFGGMAHTQYADTAVNSILKMMEIQKALIDWIPGYRNRNEYGGLKPQVSIAAIEGGWPWRASRTPAECHLYVDIRTNPERPIIDVQREVEDLVKEVMTHDREVRAEVDWYVSVPGNVLDADHELMEVMKNSHQKVVGKPVRIGFKGGCNDASHLSRYGIPTIQYGPSGRVMGKDAFGWAPGLGEHQSVDDLVACTKVYALAAYEICSK